ncbi:MAG: hypothetical protein K6G30_08865 [Acetatifactor sp.]|nr:hypothetical protein [Acetatifactor sp.]
MVQISRGHRKTNLTDEIEIIEHRKHRAVRDLIVSRDAFTLLIDDSDPFIVEKIKCVVEKMRKTLETCRLAVNGRTPYEITQQKIYIESGKGRDLRKS